MPASPVTGEAAHPPVGAGVGDDGREAPLRQQPAEGVVQRYAPALPPAERPAVAHQLAEHHPPPVEPRDEGDVHAQLLLDGRQRPPQGLRGALGSDARGDLREPGQLLGVSGVFLLQGGPPFPSITGREALPFARKHPTINRPLPPIHPSAWKARSRNFPRTALSEARHVVTASNTQATPKMCHPAYGQAHPRDARGAYLIGWHLPVEGNGRWASQREGDAPPTRPHKEEEVC